MSSKKRGMAALKKRVNALVERRDGAHAPLAVLDAGAAANGPTGSIKTSNEASAHALKLSRARERARAIAAFPRSFIPVPSLSYAVAPALSRSLRPARAPALSARRCSSDSAG